MLKHGFVAFAASVAAAASSADTPALIPFADLTRSPAISVAAVSPDGRAVATVETSENRGSIFLRKEGASPQLVHRDPARSIGNVRWSADGRWLLFLQDAGGDEGYHLYRLDPFRPGPPVDLTPFPNVTVELLPAPPGKSVPLLAAINRRDPSYPDVFIIDPATGKLTETLRNDNRFVEFFASPGGDVLAAIAIDASGMLTVSTRTSSRAPLKPLYAAPATERFKALSIAAAGDALLARTNRGQSTERLVSIALGDGVVRAVPGGDCGRYDVEDAIQDESGVAAIVCVTSRAGIKALTPAFAKLVKAASSLTGPGSSLSLESRSNDGTVAMFYSDRADRPGRFVMVRNGAASSYAETKPWLAGRQFAAAAPFGFRARDGLPLSGYVTRPRGAAAPGPAIVAVHGGPWSRDAGGFEAESQFYASRGYTVLQVNFRGSTGLGKRVFEAGVGEFGRRMSDDLDDAVAHGVRAGWIDPEHVCVLGGSYGGYAALRAVSRAGGFAYRCAVSYAGPVDLATLIEAFPPSWGPYLPRSWYRFVGNPAIESARETMAERSPLRYADRIAVPVLVFQGANDPRVTQAQSDAIVCSLRRRGVKVDYLLAGNEGHSFGNQETTMAVTRAVEQFLGAHLGGAVGAAVGEAPQETLAQFRASGLAIRC